MEIKIVYDQQTIGVSEYFVEMAIKNGGTYTTGHRDTMTLITDHYPKVEKNGCLFDYSERTYICGVRKILVREIRPDE